MRWQFSPWTPFSLLMVEISLYILRQTWYGTEAEMLKAGKMLVRFINIKPK